MHKARISGGKAADVAAANDLAIGNGNKQPVTGNGTVNGIAILNWQAGAEIDLVFTGTPTLKHNTAASAGFASLSLAGGVDFVAAVDDTLTLWYDGTVWQEKTRRLRIQEGTFTATLTGVDSSVTGTARWTRVGKAVTLFLPSLLGTSNDTACTITGMPADIFPARAKRIVVPEVRDNSLTYPGAISLATNGVMTLQFHATVPGGLGGTFTSANGKGLASDAEVAYNLL
jgi:hypothetical protein